MSSFHLEPMAVSATLHCLTGCAIGEIIGMVVGTAFNLHNVVTIILAIVLAFIFGYGLSIRSVVRHGISLRRALKLVLAADTLSIATMELVDNGVVALIPNALNATLGDWLFWLSLALSLVAAFIAAYPVNNYLLSRGKGHALLHEHHHH